MSKGKQNKARKLPKRRRPAGAPSAVARSHGKATPGDYRKLQALASLAERGDLGAAEAEIERMRQTGVSDQAIAEGEMMLSELTGDWQRLGDAAERALQYKPGDTHAVSCLLKSHLRNSRNCSVLRLLNEHFQTDQLSSCLKTKTPDEAAEIQAAFDAEVQSRVNATGLSGPAAVAVYAEHERSIMKMACDKFDEAARICRRLIEQQPQFPLPWNNLALALFQSGDFDGAVAAADASLQRNPERPYGVLFRIRLGFLTGLNENIDERLEPILVNPPEDADALCQLMETLALLGRDDDLASVCQFANDLHSENPQVISLTEHMTAYVAARQGRWDEAINQWEDCDYPGARDNLGAIDEDNGHAPFPHHIINWLPRAAFQLLAQRSDSPKRKAVRRAIEARLADLLDRGDPTAREAALQYAIDKNDPKLSAALRTFGESQRGPYSMRRAALTALSIRGALDGQPVKIWNGHEYESPHLITIEIDYEPIKLSKIPRVLALIEAAREARERDDFAKAEQLYRDAFALEPTSAAIRNNLIELKLAREDDNSWEDGIAESKRILEDHPDYLFSHIVLALDELATDQIDRARERLEPFVKRTKLHISEAIALYNAVAQIQIAEKQYDRAQHTLDWLCEVADESIPMIRRTQGMLNFMLANQGSGVVPPPKGRLAIGRSSLGMTQ